MHAANAYYQNADPGTYYHMAKSTTPKLRAIYDDTYAYVKGTYRPRTVTLSCRKQKGMVGETVRGSVRIASGCIAETLGKAAWQITAEPQHGTVSINADGVYRYVPDEGFEGVDRFTVVLAAPYASSEPLEVSVQIGEVNETTSHPDETSSELSETQEPSERTSALPWILAGVGALAAIAAAVAVFLKKKRK